MNFGHEIRRMRTELGISQTDLAEAIGMSSSLLSKRETGEVTMTKAEFMGAQVALQQIHEARAERYRQSMVVTAGAGGEGDAG